MKNLNDSMFTVTGDAGRPGQPQQSLTGITCHQMSLSRANFQFTNTQLVKTPFIFSRFNAHFTHGTKWGKAEPEENEVAHESLYPQNSSIPWPDYHDTATFR